jgi:hypothetical protein
MIKEGIPILPGTKEGVSDVNEAINSQENRASCDYYATSAAVGGMSDCTFTVTSMYGYCAAEAQPLWEP